MYKNYLDKVVPNNITLYHFIREKDYYAHFVIVRYILLVGLTNIQHNLFSKLKSTYRIELFRLLIEWLHTLIEYRCSGIYINSSCVAPLISQTYLLLSTLLAFNGSALLLNQIDEI